MGQTFVARFCDCLWQYFWQSLPIRNSPTHPQPPPAKDDDNALDPFPFLSFLSNLSLFSLSIHVGGTKREGGFFSLSLLLPSKSKAHREEKEEGLPQAMSPIVRDVYKDVAYLHDRKFHKDKQEWRKSPRNLAIGPADIFKLFRPRAQFRLIYPVAFFAARHI